MSTETSGDTSTASTPTSASAGTAAGSGASTRAQVTMQATTPEAPPERPTPPDVAVGAGIHRPGSAPGVGVLDGPAAMTVGAHRKKDSGRTKKG